MFVVRAAVLVERVFRAGGAALARAQVRLVDFQAGTRRRIVSNRVQEWLLLQSVYLKAFHTRVLEVIGRLVVVESSRSRLRLRHRRVNRLDLLRIFFHPLDLISPLLLLLDHSRLGAVRVVLHAVDAGVRKVAVQPVQQIFRLF